MTLSFVLFSDFFFFLEMLRFNAYFSKLADSKPNHSSVIKLGSIF